MYKKITTVTEEYSDYHEDDGMDPSMMHASGEPPKKYAPCIRMDIPLMIKLLQDPKPGSDVHILTSRMLEESEGGKVLTMSDYDSLANVEESKPV